MACPFLTLDDIDVSEKRVLLRGDLNTPVENGAVTDTTRLQRLAKTIHDLTARNAKVIVLSHFGRPKNGPDPSASLKVVAEALQRVVGRSVAFCPETIGPAAAAAVEALPPGGVLVLENTRFHKEEEKNDPEFARQLAGLGDVYVNDAFSASHRAHASTEGLARLLPACAGRDMEEELSTLSRALDNPEKPVMAIVGGSKISTKLDVLKNLTKKVDILVLGGGMANTFLAAKGSGVGKSLCEFDMLDTARVIMEAAEQNNCRILLPEDVVVAEKLDAHASAQTVSAQAIPETMMALDVGPATRRAIAAAMENAKTLVWNGPLGAFEFPPFDESTASLARVIAARTRMGKLLSVAGGGDTVAALNAAGVTAKFSYVSAAGGAFLEWMEGRALPGVEILRRKKAAA